MPESRIKKCTGKKTLVISIVLTIVVSLLLTLLANLIINHFFPHYKKVTKVVSNSEEVSKAATIKSIQGF